MNAGSWPSKSGCRGESWGRRCKARSLVNRIRATTGTCWTAPGCSQVWSAKPPHVGHWTVIAPTDSAEEPISSRRHGPRDPVPRDDEQRIRDGVRQPPVLALDAIQEPIDEVTGVSGQRQEHVARRRGHVATAVQSRPQPAVHGVGRVPAGHNLLLPRKDGNQQTQSCGGCINCPEPSPSP